MGLFTNPLGYAGYPPGVTANSQTVNSTVRAATAAEASAGTLADVYISPATESSSVALDFASPPVLGFGSTTPRPVHATTLSTGGAITLAEANDIAVGTTTGTKIGTATTQKLGFWNVTPVVQPGNTTDLRTALIAVGIIATGGATPLNLNGGALTAAGATSLASTAGVAAALGNATGTLGFYGSAGITKAAQTSITNSVTAGGSTGTIANFTDLTVYANDSAAIRNDIYQLALSQATLISTLKSLGLLT